jgi:4-amino-4-deoxy-L-arabinose transferase-like glycosyltransferase
MLTIEDVDGQAPALPAVALEPVAEVVVPVLNEVGCLEASIRRLRQHLDREVPFPAMVTIADNGSTDGTLELALRLSQEMAGVQVLHLEQRGRGRALRAAWGASKAQVVAYMDVDLSTDLGALVPLLIPLVAGTSDLAVGSRLAAGSHVRRCAKRELISRTYNRLLHLSLHNRFSDAQCGFKALRRSVAERLLPLVEDEDWFFDTELLLVAEQLGLRIHEVPVNWVEDPDSRVRIVRTVMADLDGIRRMRRRVRAGGDLTPPVSGDPARPPAHVGGGARSRRLLEPAGGQGIHRFVVGLIAALATGLYTWSLNTVGWGNDYYAAAVKSATVSWKAFFFGSLDPGSFITVDKPPAALWIQALSARIFGFNSWSILLPEALAGVASVLILHRLVRKWAGDVPAHLAALGLALTPVAVVMFRYNNPDAFLTLLCLGAAWAMWSSLETGRVRGLLLSAGLLGLAFNTKMLQAFLVLPAFGLVYLLFGPRRLARRIGRLLAAGGVLLASSAWWVVIVALWPADARPYIGSTTDNSIISLIFGYNGLARIFGASGSGSSGGGGGGANFGGAVSWLRMFNPIIGGQISWLLPLAGAGLVAGILVTRRRGAERLARAGWLFWGTWTAVTLLVFSRAQGIFHPYYTIQAAPAIAALAGAGAVELWRLGRADRRLAWALPAAVLGTGIWAVVLLGRTPGYDGWLRPAVLVVTVAASLALLGMAWRPERWLAGLAAGLATLALLAGPTAYALTTIANPSSGGDVAAGPATTASAGLPGGAGGSGAPGAGGAAGVGAPGAGASAGGPGSGLGSAALASGEGPGPAGLAGLPGSSSSSGSTSTPNSFEGPPPSTDRSVGAGGGPENVGGGVGGAAGARGPDSASSASEKELVAYLEENRGSAEYLVAAFTSMESAPIIIDSGDPVVTIGGFNGSDPTPTLAELEQMVAKGELHYVLVDSSSGGSGAAGGGLGGPGGSSSSAAEVEQAITSWVATHGHEVSASSYGGGSGGVTLYEVGS